VAAHALGLAVGSFGGIYQPSSAGEPLVLILSGFLERPSFPLGSASEFSDLWAEADRGARLWGDFGE
jgi:hypothetical protein